MNRISADIGVEDLSFYYEEMVRANLVELEVETPKGKIVLKRCREESSVPAAAPAAVHHSAPRRKADPAPKAEAAHSHKVIASPIMGVFYRSSSPSSPPFVQDGGTVASGATLCIIEAMKVMNEIKADHGYRIVKILSENGKPVTKGQPLFHVEPL
jgi:acetyl-CoA carboxylase biotin carboxyl carrier protein